mmetsp:Transcript_13922/g.39772  ORF Transcript_13922/g.39772 Transcript_13922/m.39772 type:complete len:245 (-) Transcript_13922:521-1255(-)
MRDMRNAAPLARDIQARRRSPRNAQPADGQLHRGPLAGRIHLSRTRAAETGSGLTGYIACGRSAWRASRRQPRQDVLRQRARATESDMEAEMGRQARASWPRSRRHRAEHCIHEVLHPCAATRPLGDPLLQRLLLQQVRVNYGIRRLPVHDAKAEGVEDNGHLASALVSLTSACGIFVHPRTCDARTGFQVPGADDRCGIPDEAGLAVRIGTLPEAFDGGHGHVPGIASLCSGASSVTHLANAN